MFTDEYRRVRPGDSCTLTLSVINLGPTEASWAIMAIGMSANWVKVQAPTVTLGSGASIPVAVGFEPPESPTTAAGATEVLVKLVPLSDPTDEVTTAETLVDIDVFDRREINTLQPIRRGRRRAVFEFLLTNNGNASANCRLSLVDPTGRVDGSFDPPATGVAPGASSLIRFRARAVGPAARLSDRELPFRVEAVEPDRATVSTHATMVQIPVIPPGSLARLAVVAALGIAATVAWFGLIRPEVRSVAQRVVDERVSQLAENAGSTRAPSPAPQSGGDPLEIIIDQSTGVETIPIAPRLEVTTTVGGVGADDYRVPDGYRFDIVDIVLMNPNGDLGRATLLRNDEIIYEWDLSLMSMPNEYQPRQSPLPIDPGATVAMRISCEGAGSMDSDGCQIAVLLGGTLSAQ
jgi:hypothetical protein